VATVVSAALLSAAGICFRYPKQSELALQDVDLTLSRGQAVGLLSLNAVEIYLRADKIEELA
jgi:ABC-type transport system involved in cytochrome bd biosynthesis fused ATPase/permease subunit